MSEMKENRTIEVLAPEFCSGCGACFNACPKDAIDMKEDAEGFFAPVIDHEKCINCGLCEKSCPVLHVPRDNEKQPVCLAVKAKPEIMKDSSSAGVFAVLADRILAEGGYVCGAAWDDSFVLRHIVTNTAEGMSRIKKSKYVQSQTGDVFRQIRDLLKQGEKVLFSGVPCQVAGLKTFLGKTYDNLYTLDIICHGAPSPGVWAKYLSEEIDTANLKEVDFRHKGDHGFKRLFIRFGYKDGTESIQPSSKNPYFHQFLHNLSLRRSCAHCEFAVFPRQGDLSAGDFWGAEKARPELIESDSGLSVLMINNAHGQELFDKVASEFPLQEPVTPKEAMGANRRHVTRSMHPNRDRFFEMFRQGTFMDAYRHNLGNKHYDVALYGATVGQNYGGLITYYALYRTVQKMGYDVITLQAPLPKDGIVTDSQGLRFCTRYMVLATRVPREQFAKKYNKIADTFLLGSDQIWNNTLFPGRRESMYLDFVKDDKKKIAYAASFGFNRPTVLDSHPERFPVITSLMHRLDYVGVRETEAVEVCENYYDMSARAVMDPVFLLDAADYDQLTANAERKPKGKYLAVYALTPKKELNRAIRFAAKKLSLRRVNMASGNQKKFEAKKKNFDQPYIENLQLEEWLYNIRNAEFVVTDSFHCTCFSILFRRQFVVVQAAWAVSRIRSLLTELNLTDRWVEGPKQMEERWDVLTQPIDYDAVHRILNEQITISKTWLRQALAGEKTVSFPGKLRKDLSFMQKITGYCLYHAKSSADWFAAYCRKEKDLILVVTKKGETGPYLKDVPFPKVTEIGTETKEKMHEGFLYVRDAAAGVIKKRRDEFAHYCYQTEDLRIVIDSEGPGTPAPEKVVEICVERDGRREIYVCKKDGLYCLLYSRSRKKVVDFIRIDTQKDEKLLVRPL